MPSAVVAEDEQLLREDLLARLREAWPELEIVAACEDGASAVEAIAEGKPDFAFLDIRMPGLTGLEVAAAAAESSPDTQVVFVTAYNQYAIDAFERGAVDYLLKPVSPERLAATVKRLKARRAEDAANPKALAAIVEQLRTHLPAEPRATALQWITASVGKETRLIMVDDVLYLKAEDKYTVVVTAEGEALIRKPIRELLEELDPARFWQIHRATIVNVDYIASVRRGLKDQAEISLRDHASTLIVSRAFTHRFKQM